MFRRSFLAVLVLVLVAGAYGLLALRGSAARDRLSELLEADPAEWCADGDRDGL